HERLYGREKESMQWQPYLMLMAKRPMAMKYTSFYDQLPLEWQNYFSQCAKEEKKEALKLLAQLLKDSDFNIATKALIHASQHGTPSPDAIKQMYIQLAKGRGIREPLRLDKPLPSMPKATRDLQRYNRFLGRGVMDGRAN
ncbi:hypothetical protein JOC37_002661, partial [Desulfohalotomaculum tongense]|nr:hypothetical protein [Desulforadius tongensis]